MRNVQASVADSDALLAIIDASVKPEEALAMIQPGPDWDGPPMAVVGLGGGGKGRCGGWVVVVAWGG